MVKRKIVVISLKDFAGSGYQISQAINRSTDYESKFVKFHGHRYKYGYDVCIGHTLPGAERDLKIAQKLIDEADLLHFKGDDFVKKQFGISRNNVVLEIPTEKPIVLTLGGSGFRSKFMYSVKEGKTKEFIKRVKNNVNVCTVLSPELNFTELNGVFIPITHDTESVSRLWKNVDVPIIGHSPSSRKTKRTDKIVIPAINILKKRGYKFEFDLIEGVKNEECLKRKKKHTIFIERGGAITYGNSAIESAQYGVPVLCPFSKNAIRRANGKLNNTAIINFKSTPKDLADIIGRLLKSDLNEISIETKKWVDNFHSYRVVGQQYIDIYDRLLK